MDQPTLTPPSGTSDRVRLFYGDVVLPDRVIEGGAVLCRGATIVAVGARQQVQCPAGAEIVDAGSNLISPGFVDIHVHGGGGADFMDGTVEAVLTVTRTHARHGTTCILPTTTTGSREQIAAMLRACRAARDQWRIGNGSRVEGAHFYGPYFAADRVGCHSPGGRRNPDRAEYLEHFDLGIVRVATCAAELPGAEEFYQEARRRGYFVTCGHSNSDWAEMDRAFHAGMRHVDHFWCAMSSVDSLRETRGTPMRASMEQYVLANPEMSTEVIADGCHLSAELLEFAFRMLGPDRLLLVTDSSRAVDMPPGRYCFGPESEGEWIWSNGKIGMDETGSPASSIMGMDTMVRTMKTLTRATIPEVIRMASHTPARRLGIDDRLGSLQPGKRADLLVLDRDLNIQQVYLSGERFTG